MNTIKTENSHTHIDENCNCNEHESNTPIHEYNCGCEHSSDSNSVKKDIVSIVIAGILLIPAMLVSGKYINTLLYLTAILVAGLPIIKNGVKNIFKLKFNEITLMSIAVIAAFILGEYFEALLVTILFRVGEMLEDIAVNRSSRAVEAVTNIIPENANLLTQNGNTITVKARELNIGSKIIVKSGERVPVDCAIINGNSSIDASSLTGESVAREVFTGDAILSGSINLGGALTCETTSSFSNSTASKIIEMVKESATQKSKTERLISRFAVVYTPIVLIAALMVSVIPPLLGFGTFSLWVMRALVFLVASCPCALVISVPLSYFAGIGAASKQGILIKGSRYMEVLANATTVVFDKTGTLTTGNLEVSEINASNGFEKSYILQIAAICESYSNHPIAKAIVAANGTTDISQVESCNEITSYGMDVVISGTRYLCGSSRLMKQEKISVESFPTANVYLATNGEIIGTISVIDQPRADAKQAIQQLKELGINQTIMLTGDNTDAAENIQKLTGIGNFFANLLPADKVDNFKAIKSKSQGTCIFVGDGINDSPVIAVADAGIAIGLAADAAIEAADVVLLSNKLSSLPQAIRISKNTSKLAKFNIILALLVKAIVFILAFAGMAQMWMAVFADVGVAIISVLNATRALKFK